MTKGLKLDIDIKKMVSQLDHMKFSSLDLLTIEQDGAEVNIQTQQDLVPLDLGTTRDSIQSHITKSTPTWVEDEIGPETDYSIYLEYGTGEYAENGNGRKGGWRYKDSKGQWHFTFGMKPQPYVRPSAKGTNLRSVFAAIAQAYIAYIRSKWKES